MLLKLQDLINEFKLEIQGIVHVGACRCEEEPIYTDCKVLNVLWLEANADVIAQTKQANPKLDIHHAVISDCDDKTISFMVTDNLQSSSILELDKHKEYHPWVKESHRVECKTVTLDTFFCRNKTHNPSHYNFMNIDIQGAELLALKGARHLLQTMKYLYLEVNDEHLYKHCALVSEIDAFLSPFGFRRVKTKWTEHHWGDALYIKASSSSSSSSTNTGPVSSESMTSGTVNQNKDSEYHVLEYPDFESRGRLGNQLFQIAGLLAMTQWKSGVVPKWGTRAWKYASCFPESVNWFHNLDSRDSTDISLQETFDWRKIEEELGSHRVPHMQIANAFANRKQTRQILQGYFQTTKLITPELRPWFLNTIFKIHPQLRKHALSILARHIKQRPWCILHIRRGDYCSLRGGKSICLDKSYYLQVMDFVSKQFQVKTFLVCTDDPTYVQETMKMHGDASLEVRLASDFLPNHLSIEEREVVELQLMALAPFKIISNSTFSWWGAYLDANAKHITIAPSTFFPHQTGSEAMLLPGWRTHPARWEDLSLNNIPAFPVHPCGYSLPESRMISLQDVKANASSKTSILADCLPGIKETYRFGPGEEDAYRAMYKSARFAWTKGKAGFDALRHYEILANGCFPMFTDLSDCPAKTMTQYPKELVQHYSLKLLPWKGTPEQRQCYDEATLALLTHLHERLSTRAHARRICDELQISYDDSASTSTASTSTASTSASTKVEKPQGKILLLLCHPGVNYLREMTIIGLHQLLGPARFLEYPKMGLLYTSCSETEAAKGHGFGFSYSGELQDDKKQDALRQNDQQILDMIKRGEFQWIIYGKVGPDENGVGSAPNLPFWSSVRSMKTRVAFLYGGDKAMGENNPHLHRHRQFGPCFVRELL